MAGSTPKLGLPYPTGSDRVMDGDNAIQSLAETIETRFGDSPGMRYFLGTGGNVASGWNPITTLNTQSWKNGSFNTAAGGKLQVAVKGIYLIGATAAWGTAVGSVTRRGVGVRLNGATFVTSTIVAATAVANGASQAVTVYPLNANDLLELMTYHDGASQQPIGAGDGSTYLEAMCLART